MKRLTNKWNISKNFPGGECPPQGRERPSPEQDSDAGGGERGVLRCCCVSVNFILIFLSLLSSRYERNLFVSVINILYTFKLLFWSWKLFIYFEMKAWLDMKSCEVVSATKNLVVMTSGWGESRTKQSKLSAWLYDLDLVQLRLRLCWYL